MTCGEEGPEQGGLAEQLRVPLNSYTPPARAFCGFDHTIRGCSYDAKGTGHVDGLVVSAVDRDARSKSVLEKTVCHLDTVGG